MRKLRIDSPVITYITEEVARQGHDLLSLDGIQRVGWMTDGWCYALSQRYTYNKLKPTVDDVIQMGKMVERYKNAGGVRQCDVFVGWKACPGPEHLNRLLVGLFEAIDTYDDPILFYKAFESVHPFEDGNGRTGKIILNWLNGTLLDPIFPPSTLWGKHPIQNP